MPLKPGSGKSPFKVMLAKDLDSELLKLVQVRYRPLLMPTTVGCRRIASGVSLLRSMTFMDVENGPLSKVNDIYGNRLFQEMQAQAHGDPITKAMQAVAKKIISNLCSMSRRLQLSYFFTQKGRRFSSKRPPETLFGDGGTTLRRYPAIHRRSIGKHRPERQTERCIVGSWARELVPSIFLRFGNISRRTCRAHLARAWNDH